jgi:hypothetical protein
LLVVKVNKNKTIFFQVHKHVIKEKVFITYCIVSLGCCVRSYNSGLVSSHNLLKILMEVGK